MTQTFKSVQEHFTLEETNENKSDELLLEAQNQSTEKLN